MSSLLVQLRLVLVGSSGVSCPARRVGSGFGPVDCKVAAN